MCVCGWVVGGRVCLFGVEKGLELDLKGAGVWEVVGWGYEWKGAKWLFENFYFRRKKICHGETS